MFDIESQFKFIQEGFEGFYSQNGYEQIPPASILAKEDPTVIFTGATITPFIPRLITGIQSPGICSVQPCLRTQNLNSAHDNTVPEYMSYFRMCGSLATSSRGNEVVSESLTLLTKIYGIKPENITVRASSRDKDLTEPLRIGITTEIDTRPASYYNWSYGRDWLKGRGITYAIRGKNRNDYRDVGNVVAIEQNDKIVGYEFGFGIETILSRIYGLTRPIEAAKISKIIPFKEGVREKLSDFLAAATVMVQNGINPGIGKEKHILKAYLKAISYWQRKLDIRLEQIEMWINTYCQLEFGEIGNNGTKILDFLKKYNNKIEEYRQFAANQIHANRLNKRYDLNTLKKQLLSKGQHYQLSPVDTIMVLDKLLSQR